MESCGSFYAVSRRYPSIWVSPQIEIAWPEMVRRRGLHMKRTADRLFGDKLEV